MVWRGLLPPSVPAGLSHRPGRFSPSYLAQPSFALPRAYGTPAFPLPCLAGGTRPGEEVRDGPHANNRRCCNRGGVAPTAPPLRPKTGSLSGFRPLVVDRNICHLCVVWCG